MNDSGVHDALLGSGAALVPHSPAEESRPAVFVRSAMGPFTSREAVNSSTLPEEKKQYIIHEIEKFRRLSAVLFLRLKLGYSNAELILNPNTDKPIRPKDAKLIVKVANRRIIRVGQGTTH